MAHISNEVLKALFLLVVSGIVYLAWKFSYDYAKQHNLQKTLLRGFLWCAGIALFSCFMLGTHMENDNDSDPVYGSPSVTRDYHPTRTQRTANFAYIMTLLYTPTVMGAFKGRKKQSP